MKNFSISREEIRKNGFSQPLQPTEEIMASLDDRQNKVIAELIELGGEERSIFEELKYLESINPSRASSTSPDFAHCFFDEAFEVVIKKEKYFQGIEIL